MLIIPALNGENKFRGFRSGKKINMIFTFARFSEKCYFFVVFGNVFLCFVIIRFTRCFPEREVFGIVVFI